MHSFVTTNIDPMMKKTLLSKQLKHTKNKLCDGRFKKRLALVNLFG
jgi:hypothetical protein